MLKLFISLKIVYLFKEIAPSNMDTLASIVVQLLQFQTL